ncbi:adhesion G-protein coupled receptor G6 isoform X4 [Pangasianodon hypophthalmus]|uniref:adhesion G-protein coupled receptor G6 isoform X4 n=1 Tax=Pangasianodon hypophthalmus TaxID=310915 RepID=UPI00230730DD|nr:adhesion G-protein coupled receptor G6 isoform X4 [Pangasianodon hypophthalmus]
MVSYISGRWWRWKFWNVLQVALFLICIARTAVLSCQGECDETLTASDGIFTSPCYPNDYPPSQTCTWTLQAPAGFVLQLTFLDFELEEAQGCIYDSVIVNTGASSVKFCGLTANGLTLNSSTNVMVVSFHSDFSVQKKGFSISYRQVAVALRNQKVTVPQNFKDVVRVSSLVSIPALSQFTACFEITGQSQTGSGIIFSYTETEPHLTFGNSGNSMDLIIGNATCPVSDLVTLADFTSNMQLLCITWSNTNGAVAVYFKGSYRVKFCSNTVGMKLGTGGSFELGRGKKQGQNFDGLIYNFRLWSSAMTSSELATLTCDAVGNVVDWDNSFWDIPASYAQTDSSLSCSTAMPATTSQTTTCVSPGVGCPASLTTTTSSIVNTNTIPTNARTNDLSITISYTTTPSISLTAATVKTTSSATTYSPATASAPTAAATNPLSNHASSEFTYYRISLIVSDDLQITDESIVLWLNQTFQDWNHTIYVTNVSILPGTDSSSTTSKRYSCKALLVYRNATGKLLTDADIKNRLSVSAASFTLDNIAVNAVENCQAEETPLHYKWPESRPSVTHFIPCFPYKEQNASRTCMISVENYSSYWDQPDLVNCKDIEDIEVSQENAAEVAVQLADITNNELSTVELSKVVTVVTKLVNVARINVTLASTVVNIISNVMISSESVQLAASEMALKTMDKLVQKIEFDGPSLTITSKNLAVGISAINASSFIGANFSAFMALNSSDPQIDFESEVHNSLASVSLPATLLHNLSEADVDIISRINFMFFSKTGLFQHFGSLMDQQNNGLSLNSYVVASSVGNFSISNLKDPVQIEIAHLQHQWNQNRLCVFWDFSIENGTGGWNSEGCEVSPESNSNKTVCLCNHLTHFGVLMDLSGAAAHINERNTKILTFITYIGCGISAIFSAVTILTYVAFEKLRRDYPSKILMNLSTSLLFLNMTFLLDGWLASYEMQGLCMAVAAFLHFFLLTSFTWMGLESVHMYIALVKVFNTYIRRYILKFCIVGWGLPAVIVALVLAADKNSYGKEFYGKGANGQGLSEFCWIRSKVVFYVTCVAYFCIIFILNVAMFIVVMIQICGRNGKRNNRTLQEEVLRNLRSVISLTFLLGMTWGFAFFAWGPVTLVFMYLFSIFNSLQGLFIFVFHCALKENVQKQWRRYLCCGKLRLADNSDWSKTATNNTKKVSSDNIGKSLSSSSFGSTTVNWTSKARVTLNPFAKRHSSSGKPYSNQASQKCSTSDSDASTSSILPVHQVLDKVKGYCSVRSDNFYKNIILSDSLSHSTKF